MRLTVGVQGGCISHLCPVVAACWISVVGGVGYRFLLRTAVLKSPLPTLFLSVFGLLFEELTKWVTRMCPVA